MLSKKKKIIVLVGMIMLLVLVGCLNIFLNKKTEPLDPINTNKYGNFFDTYRADRIATREETMLYLDAIIANASSSSEAKSEAESSKLKLTQNMELELALEGLIKALGFDDAVITTSTENINVIVKAKELTSAQVAQILSVITTETDKTANNVIIIPVE